MCLHVHLSIQREKNGERFSIEHLLNFVFVENTFLSYVKFVHVIFLNAPCGVSFAGLQAEVSRRFLLRSRGIAVLRDALPRQERILVCRMPQTYHWWVQDFLRMESRTMWYDCLFLVLGRCITAMFRKFHPEHFVCAFCLKQLNKGTFKEQNDKPYCHGCFDKLFG